MMNLPRILISLLLTQSSLARINIKDASFSSHWIDFIFPDTSFKISRTYNSRSLHSGIFGFGWCSNFEKKITIGQTILYTDCLGRRLEFVKAQGDFYSSGPIKLKRHKGLYVVRINQSLQAFDQSGRLTAIIKNKKILRFTYRPSGQIESIYTKQTHIKLKYRGKKLKALIGSPVKYHYSGDQLTAVKNAWGNRFQYRYDQLHNMTDVDFPDGTRQSMRYDSKNDRIAQYTDRKGCQQILNYKPRKRKDRYMVEIKSPCNETESIRFNFRFNTRLPGLPLHKISRIQSDGDKFYVTLHAHTGLPTKIERGDRVFQFDPSGRVRIYQDSKSRMSFNYTAASKIDSVTVHDKLTKTRQDYEYFYNRYGYVSEIRSSDMGSIFIDYDESRQIQKISTVDDSIELQHNQRRPTATLRLTKKTTEQVIRFTAPLRRLQQIDGCIGEGLWLYGKGVRKCNP